MSGATTAPGSFLQRMTGWLGGLPGKAAIVLPVRAGGTEYRQTTATPASVLGFDQALLWVVVALLSWGLVMVYSASIAMPDNPRFGKIAPTHFLMRHLFALVMAFVAALLAFQVSMATWERSARVLFVFALALLVLVLVPHVGTVVNGARRWLSLGIMNFQPSELAKFAVLIYAADYMCRKMDVKERFFRAVLPMGAAVAIVGVLAARFEPGKWTSDARPIGDPKSRDTKKALAEQEAREALALNHGSLACIDDAVGRVMARLRDLGLDDHTVVMFTSDHPKEGSLVAILEGEGTAAAPAKAAPVAPSPAAPAAPATSAPSRATGPGSTISTRWCGGWARFR